MKTQIALKSKRVLLPDGCREAIVLLSNGKIVDVISEIPYDYSLIDLDDKVIMPAIIDPHVHINEPGRTEWEGFDTAGKAALAGGITTLIDMPLNSTPVTTTAESFQLKLKSASASHVNIGFWGGVIPGNENNLEALAKKGVRGFKAFLTHSGIDDFPNVTEKDLRKAMPIIAGLGLPLLFHCEITNDQHQPKSTNQYQTYLESRPKEWEDNAIDLVIRLCREFNCRTHVVHLSSSNSIDTLRKAKQEGLPITVETAPHYLYFEAEKIPDKATEYKCAPPIREKSNNDQLWEALREGIIDFIATDHSPAPPELKEIKSGDFMKAWGGIASLQFTLPIMWTAAKQRGFTLNELLKWLCEKPAFLPGLEFRKGKIAKGYDADLVVWDPEASFTVTEKLIQHRHKITPYLNQQLFGIVIQTWLKGECVYADGKFLHLNRGELLIE